MQFPNSASVPLCVKLETEKFIREMEKHPALYNWRLPEYSSTDIKAEMWEQVGMRMYGNWPAFRNEDKRRLEREMQARWNSLRDEFKKALFAVKSTESGGSAANQKKFLYFDQLLFLTPLLEARGGVVFKPRGNVFKPRDNDVDKPFEQIISIAKPLKTNESPERSTSPLPNPNVSNGRKRRADSAEVQAFKAMTNILSESLAVEKERSSDKMGNKAFAMSLVPILDELSKDISIDARLRILQVLQQCRLQDFCQRHISVQPAVSHSSAPQPIPSPYTSPLNIPQYSGDSA